MNIPTVFDWRNRRNLNHMSIQSVNYSTYSLPDFTEKKNMKSEIFDMYNTEKTFSEIAADKKMDDKSEKSEPWLIRSALQVCSMIFRKLAGRASSPDLCYHDCESLPGQVPPSGCWRDASTQNKNMEADTDKRSDMNGDYKSVVASCEDKLNKVRQLITSKPVPSSPKCSPYRSRRRKRVFVESSSVEDNYEDAFSSEQFVSNSNSDTVTLIVPYQYQNFDLIEIDAPKMKIETCDAALKGQSKPENKEQLNTKPEIVKTEVVEHIGPEQINKSNIETVTSCESKIMQLQAMLKNRCKKNTKTMLNSPDSVSEPDIVSQTDHTKPKHIPAPKVQDKRYKNRYRISTGKRKNIESKKLIEDDMVFADEIVDDNTSSFDHSPIIKVALDKSLEFHQNNRLATPAEDCFDEIAGRFHCASGTDSEDSFQVVFSDSPRAKRPSDCESEDSFILFEDSPDSCYTSNDVFGDDSESEYSDTDSEVSDSGCGNSDELKISHNMTKTFEDLTDGRLYDDKDEVDNAGNICEEIHSDAVDLVNDVKCSGVLLNDARKQLRKNQPPKKVQFSPKPPVVHVLRVWAFAARQARAGHWERHSIDRERFRRRIADADVALSWVLRPQHRARIKFQRFMPWWNKLRRDELEHKRKQDEARKLELENETQEPPSLDCDGEDKQTNDETTNVEEQTENIDKERNSKDKNYIKGEQINKEEITNIGERIPETEKIGSKKDMKNIKETNNEEKQICIDTGKCNKEQRNNKVQVNNNRIIKKEKQIANNKNEESKFIEDHKEVENMKLNKSPIKIEVTDNSIEKRTNILKSHELDVRNKTNTDSDKKVKGMEIILKEDKHSVIPLTVSNEIVS